MPLGGIDCSVNRRLLRPPDAAEQLDEAPLIVRAERAADVALMGADHALELLQHGGAVFAQP